MSRGGGHPSSQQKEEPGWPHAFGCCLRAVLHRAATSLGLPLPMSSNCICIAAPLSLSFQMKTTNRIPIAGALTRPGDRNAGNWYRNGSGTSAWSWGISCILIPCARPSLLLPSHLPHPLHLFHRTRLLPRAMLPLRWACPGKRTASRVKTSLSNQMGRCGVPLASRWLLMSNAEKPMGAYASSMREVTVVAVPVPCASSANGRAAPPRSRAR